MSVYVGLGISASASFMNALGLNVQRLAGKEGAAGWLNPVGVALSTGSGIVDAVSYGFAPQSTLAPMGAATLVFNLLLAPILHGTNLGVSDVVFTSLIIFGVVLCILGSNSTQQEYSLEKLYELAFSRPFQILVASELALFAILQMHARRREQNGQGHLLSTGVAYPICAGMLGGATVLCAKVLTSAVSLGADVLTVLLPLSIVTAVCAVTQIVVNNRGLTQHPPMVIVPIFSSCFVVSNAVGGGVFFQDFHHMASDQWMLYGVGVGSVVAGVLLIARAAAAAGRAKQQ